MSDYKSCVKYLADRNIDEILTKRCGILNPSNAAVREMGYTFMQGEGTNVLITFPGTNYWKLRIMEPGTGPKALAPTKEEFPLAPMYFPQIIDWEDPLKQPPNQRLYICEDPVKAINLAMHGYHAISGAGGVNTVYMSQKQKFGAGWPDSDLHGGRYNGVVICFDRDTEGKNKMVRRAVRILAGELTSRYGSRGVKVWKKVLPAPPKDSEYGDNWGLDDFQHTVGRDKFLEWVEDDSNLRVVESNDLKSQLAELNEDYTVDHGRNKVIHIHRRSSHSPGDFKNITEANRLIKIPQDEAKPIEVSVAGEWLKWEDRRWVKCTAYEPGGERIVSEEYYNEWEDDGVVARQGDVSPWLDLMKLCVQDSRVRDLLVKCMAWQVQRRGQVKLPKLLWFYSQQVGTGKTTQLEIMERVLGPSNSCLVDVSVFKGEATSTWSRKELVKADDLEKLDPGMWSKIKGWVTGATVRHRALYNDGVMMKSTAVWYVTSNDNDILPMDTDERRVLMVNWNPPADVVKGWREEGNVFWEGFYRWLDEEGGAEAVRWYLEREVDIEGWNPNFHPPMTEAKKEAIASNKSSAELWLREWVAGWDASCGLKYVTSGKLFSLYTSGESLMGDPKAQEKFTRLIGKKGILHTAHSRLKMGGSNQRVYYCPPVAEEPPGPLGNNDEIKSNWEEYAKELDVTMEGKKVGF